MVIVFVSMSGRRRGITSGIFGLAKCDDAELLLNRCINFGLNDGVLRIGEEQRNNLRSSDVSTGVRLIRLDVATHDPPLIDLDVPAQCQLFLDGEAVVFVAVIS